MHRTITWEEAYNEAIGEAKYGTARTETTREEFIETVLAFYRDIVTTNNVTDAPTGDGIDVVQQRAAVVWADDIGGREGGTIGG
jgi:hypothetical protein